MKTIYFVRHGEAEANKIGLLAGAKTDSPLTEAGRNHGYEVSKELGTRTIELIISSPLSRASDTAKIIANDIGYDGEIVISPLFIERDFGSATNQPKTEAFAALDNGTATGVESILDFGVRASRALEFLRSRSEEHILIVSHAGFGQMLGTIVSGGRSEDFLSFESLSNGGMFEFTLDEA